MHQVNIRENSSDNQKWAIERYMQHRVQERFKASNKTKIATESDNIFLLNIVMLRHVNTSNENQTKTVFISHP